MVLVMPLFAQPVRFPELVSPKDGVRLGGFMSWRKSILVPDRRRYDRSTGNADLTSHKPLFFDVSRTI
jgi:hypothetical protein